MVGIAAIVQKMINSQKAGVIFSVDPVKGGTNIMVEAVFGQGEGIVSGKIKPDQYYVSRDLEIVKENISDKKIAVVRDSSGTGKIIKSFPKDLKVLVEGLNLKKKHVRPKREGEKGQVVAIPAPLDVSNVKLICPKCGKATRVGYAIEGENKNRICKKCKQTI